jgi:hypothetical protein
MGQRNEFAQLPQKTMFYGFRIRIISKQKNSAHLHRGDGVYPSLCPVHDGIQGLLWSIDVRCFAPSPENQGFVSDLKPSQPAGRVRPQQRLGAFGGDKEYRNILSCIFSLKQIRTTPLATIPMWGYRIVIEKAEKAGIRAIIPPKKNPKA